TKRLPDEVIQVRDLSNFKIAPATNAPANWSGRAIISFEMQNTEANTRAKVIVRPASTKSVALKMRSNIAKLERTRNDWE
ncbi:hypothetical protein J7M23_01890, partial [Candidatus Sumerlaeota bacterium]|nr:hypothetical protein [Candidatus Sumerlaeota bacterium]